uniref:Uncharacterized protein n=1 Tax=Pseudomonas chaetocerotis TaxID=2758695 RepID=A0A931GFX7_9PSED
MAPLALVRAENRQVLPVKQRQALVVSERRTASIDELDAEVLDMPMPPTTVQSAKLDTVMSINFGPGGTNAPGPQALAPGR